MRTLLLLERQLSPPLDNISSYIGFTEHIYPSFGPEAFGLEIRFSIIFNEEKFQTSSPTTSFLHRLRGPRSALCARLQLLQSIICDQNSSRESLFDQNLLVLKFTWKPLWWQLRVDAIVFANNGIYRWIVANAISVKLPNLSKIVWTRLNLLKPRRAFEFPSSWNCVAFEQRTQIFANEQIFEIKYKINLSINVSKPNLNPSTNFGFGLNLFPVRRPQICLSFKCLSRTLILNFFGHSVVPVAILTKACWHFTDCPSRPNCDLYICYNFSTNTYFYYITVWSS